MIKQPDFKFLLAHPAHFLALGFGSGLPPKAPGTFGTIAGLPLFYLIAGYALNVQLAIIAGLFIIGIYFCDVAGKALGVSDHGSIVWDEIVAMMLVLTITPNHGSGGWLHLVYLGCLIYGNRFPFANAMQNLKVGLASCLMTYSLPSMP